ncbi:MAG TPA: PqqD family peptide modification chaperone [Rhodocyclaceae bacterium]|nr:PqqD family peptide modification chaperone [Rhodocyclaceae bacterium]
MTASPANAHNPVRISEPIGVADGKIFFGTHMTTQDTTISLDSNVCRREGALSAQVDDALVLMSVENGAYYSLDAVGSDIWNRIESPVLVADLCAALQQEYDADDQTIRRDVLALLQQLAAENLIELRP